jgi:hypothetical protein
MITSDEDVFESVMSFQRAGEDIENYEKRIAELEAENKRLREALEAISLMESPAPHVKDIARQALEER